jgi:hypothetical protein
LRAIASQLATRIENPLSIRHRRYEGNASRQKDASKTVIKAALNSKGDMKAIDVTTEKAERVALRFQDETGSVLRLVPRGHDYALYEDENLLAIFLYWKGAANVARLLVQAQSAPLCRPFC